MIDMILSISTAGLVVLGFTTMMSIIGNLVSNKKTTTLPWRIFGVLVLLPLWLSVLLYGSWLVYLPYYIVLMTVIALLPERYKFTPEAIAQMQEAKETGLFGCFMMLGYIASFTLSVSFFALFQWVR